MTLPPFLLPKTDARSLFPVVLRSMRFPEFTIHSDGSDSNGRPPTAWRVQHIVPGRVYIWTHDQQGLTQATDRRWSYGLIAVDALPTVYLNSRIYTVFTGACDQHRVGGFILRGDGKPDLDNQVYAGTWGTRQAAVDEIAAIQAAHVLQKRVWVWAATTFHDRSLWFLRKERVTRFLEEALELAQAVGLTEDHAKRLLTHVFSRPTGDIPQEVAGTVVTLAALSEALCINMHVEALTEMRRIEQPEMREKIRAKQADKDNV